jgi:hypothetical protein
VALLQRGSEDGEAEEVGVAVAVPEGVGVAVAVPVAVPVGLGLAMGVEEARAEDEGGTDGEGDAEGGDEGVCVAVGDAVELAVGVGEAPGEGLGVAGGHTTAGPHSECTSGHSSEPPQPAMVRGLFAWDELHTMLSAVREPAVSLCAGAKTRRRTSAVAACLSHTVSMHPPVGSVADAESSDGFLRLPSTQTLSASEERSQPAEAEFSPVVGGRGCACPKVLP